MSTNTWYHIAAVRAGSTITLYINGIAGATVTSSATLGRSDYNLWLGAQHSGGPVYYFNGYVDDVRITNGVARYLYNFSPPNAAFYNIGASSFAAAGTDSYFGQTSLLLHGDGTNAGQNNTFLDGSTNAFTITRNGNTTQGSFKIGRAHV